MKVVKKIIISLIVVLGVIAFILGSYIIYKNKKVYEAQDFKITPIISEADANNNGIDDYTEIMLGAREDAINHPKYDGSYYNGGYPPDDIGVCTDVVWRAFKKAGYDLKKMVDEDIAKNNDTVYKLAKIDPNIDFRRVRNLYYFFERNSEVLTTDITKIEEWQPGDIVIFGENHNHIGIISDKRNSKGIPYLIHNNNQPFREEDVLERYSKKFIAGHYRFNTKYAQNLEYFKED